MTGRYVTDDPRASRRGSRSIGQPDELDVRVQQVRDRRTREDSFNRFYTSPYWNGLMWCMAHPALGKPVMDPIPVAVVPSGTGGTPEYSNAGSISFGMLLSQAKAGPKAWAGRVEQQFLFIERPRFMGDEKKFLIGRIEPTPQGLKAVGLKPVDIREIRNGGVDPDVLTRSLADNLEYATRDPDPFAGGQSRRKFPVFTLNHLQGVIDDLGRLAAGGAKEKDVLEKTAMKFKVIERQWTTAAKPQ
ncbi:MAG: hypothetical protein PHG85_01530 [Candidatus Altiarchaeota archaeon]|nr:hypothetical protein [Candidatus Altiarchaeota archaeon]